MAEKTNNPGETDQGKRGIRRRDLLKGLATLPILGVFAHQAYKKLAWDRQKKGEILSELGLKTPAAAPAPVQSKPGSLIRIGIIGFGVRGEQLARALGFAHPSWIEERKKSAQANKLDRELTDWLQQEDLHVAITGICDVFDERAQAGLIASKGLLQPGGAPELPGARRFQSYQELLASPEVDAVIITTPDFHHAQMTIDAAAAGKHIYCEKCLTRTEAEVFQVEAALKNSSVVFQLGHQYPQNECFGRAREIVAQNLLGKITLVETCSNRNSPNGAWVRHLDSKGNLRPGNPSSIDWRQWLGASPAVPFDIERFYNWTKYWEYATGLSGQLFSHEYDAVNQILGLGIPKSCVASGGIYFYKDGREIPDIFHAVFEFPDRDLTLTYSASLASSLARGRVFMGHDAWMEVGGSLKVVADRESTRYQDKIRSGVINPDLPLLTFQPGQQQVDAITSASQQYYATRGLIYTYRDGRRVDMAHLHLKEWLNAIRFGTPLSCPIEKGIEVTMACHMATRSYREQRRVEWDAVNRKIV